MAIVHRKDVKKRWKTFLGRFCQIWPSTRSEAQIFNQSSFLGYLLESNIAIWPFFSLFFSIMAIENPKITYEKTSPVKKRLVGLPHKCVNRQRHCHWKKHNYCAVVNALH
jgi:hypothetical protein